MPTTAKTSPQPLFFSPEQSEAVHKPMYLPTSHAAFLIYWEGKRKKAFLFAQRMGFVMIWYDTTKREKDFGSAGKGSATSDPGFLEHDAVRGWDWGMGGVWFLICENPLCRLSFVDEGFFSFFIIFFLGGWWEGKKGGWFGISNPSFYLGVVCYRVLRGLVALIRDKIFSLLYTTAMFFENRRGGFFRGLFL